MLCERHLEWDREVRLGLRRANWLWETGNVAQPVNYALTLVLKIGLGARGELPTGVRTDLAFQFLS